MMKWIKKVGLLSLASSLVLGLGQPVQAQRLSLEDFLNKAVNAALQTKTAHVEWSGSTGVHLEGFQGVELLGSTEGKADVDLDRMKGQASLTFDSYAGDYQLEATLLDGTLYGLENGSDIVESMDVKDVTSELKEAIFFARQISEWGTAGDAEVLQDLVDFEENESGYVLRLKETIDGRAFYRKHQAYLELVKAGAIYQVTQESGDSETAKESTALIHYAFNEDAFAAFFASKPTYTAQYDKDFRLVKLEVDVQFPVEQGADFDFGFTGALTLLGDLTVSRYGEPVEVIRP